MHELMPLLNDVHVLGPNDHRLQFIWYTGQYSHEFIVHKYRYLQTYKNGTCMAQLKGHSYKYNYTKDTDCISV